MSLRIVLRSSCDRCSRVTLGVALILVRSLSIFPSQDLKCELTISSYYCSLCLSDNLGYNFPAAGSHLEIGVRDRLQCPNDVASL